MVCSRGPPPGSGGALRPPRAGVCAACVSVEEPNPIPALPTFDQYNLGLSQPTTFEAFRVYVPWVAFEKRAAGIPADYAISGITPDNTEHFFPLITERGIVLVNKLCVLSTRLYEASPEPVSDL